MPSVFCPTGSSAFCYLYPVGLTAPISRHLWTQAPARFCFNSQQSSTIRKAICIFCKVHLHSQGLLVLLMLNLHPAKQFILGVLSCHSLLVCKVSNPSLVLQLDYLSWSIPVAPQILDSWWESKEMHLKSYPNCSFYLFSIPRLSTCHLYFTCGIYAVMEGDWGLLTCVINFLAGHNACILYFLNM